MIEALGPSDEASSTVYLAFRELNKFRTAIALEVDDYNTYYLFNRSALDSVKVSNGSLALSNGSR